MDKHAVKVVKGDETVGHLSRKFSQFFEFFSIVFSSTEWRSRFSSDWSQTVWRIGGSMPVRV